MPHTPSDIEVDILTKQDVQTFIDNALKQANHSWPELQKQAKDGCFTTETARRAWFVVSAFADTQ